jgi:outer membrane protein
MMNLRICVTAYLFFFSLFFFSENLASEGKPIPKNLIFTMVDCINRGIELSPRIAAKGCEIQKAEDEIKIVRSGFLPSLSANYNINEIHSSTSSGPSDSDYLDQVQNDYGLTLTQGIFSGFTTMNLYQMKHLEKELAGLEKELEINSLIVEIQSDFIKVLMYSEQIKNYKNSVERLIKKTKAIKEYFKKKMVPYTQVLAVDVELSDARKELSMAKSNYRIQKNKLNTLIGIPFDVAVHYTGDVKKIPVYRDIMIEGSLATALKTRPEILQILKKIKIAEKEKSIIKGRYSPEVSVSAGYSHIERDYNSPGQDIFGNSVDRDQMNEYWSVGTKVVWPIFEGRKKYYQLKKTDNEIQRLKQLYKLLKANITNEVINGYYIVEETIKRIEFSKTALKEANESYKRAEKKLSINIGTITEVLEAQAKLLEAETNHSLDWCQYAIALSKLFSTTGQPKYNLINDSL